MNKIKTCREGLNSVGLVKKIPQLGKLFCLKRKKMLLHDVLAVYISDHPKEADATLSAVVKRLDRDIFTAN